MQLTQQWRNAALAIDEIVFSPAGLGQMDAPQTYLKQIYAAADGLESLSSELSHTVRADADRLAAIIDQWGRIWWPEEF